MWERTGCLRCGAGGASCQTGCGACARLRSRRRAIDLLRIERTLARPAGGRQRGFVPAHRHGRRQQGAFDLADRWAA
eukprot:364483-Chlamydomonas_euryale.AAC.7